MKRGDRTGQLVVADVERVDLGAMGELGADGLRQLVRGNLQLPEFGACCERRQNVRELVRGKVQRLEFAEVFPLDDAEAAKIPGGWSRSLRQAAALWKLATRRRSEPYRRDT